jgi:coniferyl-aldehyde dehydrogenase
VGNVPDENVENILGTKMLKNGQMCISVDYVLCPKSNIEAFTSSAEKLFKDKPSNYATSADNTIPASFRSDISIASPSWWKKQRKRA